MGGIEVIWQGRRVTVPELSRETGISDYMFYKWLRKGYTPEEVVEHARSPRGEKHEYRGQWLTIRQLAYIAGMTPSTISYRMHTGWSVEDAVNTPVGARPGGGPPPKREKPSAADTPEGQRWNAAHEICKTIAASPRAFNFRCTQPMTEYAFESDLLGYTIRFLTPTAARLTAYWKNGETPSDLYRIFEVNGEKIREVPQR